jgi:hypothetical protein
MREWGIMLDKFRFNGLLILFCLATPGIRTEELHAETQDVSNTVDHESGQQVMLASLPRSTFPESYDPLEISSEAKSDSTQAWQHYDFAIRAPSVRESCMPYLVDSMEQIGLFGESLDLIEQLKQAGNQNFVDPGPARKVQEARLKIKLGQFDQGIVELENLLAGTLAPDMQEETLTLLARGVPASAPPARGSTGMATTCRASRGQPCPERVKPF